MQLSSSKNYQKRQRLDFKALTGTESPVCFGPVSGPHAVLRTGPLSTNLEPLPTTTSATATAAVVAVVADGGGGVM